MSNNSVYVIGLTGGIGSGKSTIASIFEQIGIECIDADQIAKEIVTIGSSTLNEITSKFGNQILLDNGALNRSKLKEIIFNNVSDRAWLESVMHPKIKLLIQDKINNSISAYVILMHPLLFETNQHKFCSKIISISVSREIQISRIISRDNISRDLAEKIMNSQLSDKDRCEKSDYIINNTNSLSSLYDKVHIIHKDILKLIHEQKI